MSVLSATGPDELVALDGRRACKVLVVATVVVVGFGLLREVFLVAFGAGTLLRDLRHFSLNGEHNLAAWHESSLMLVAALISFLLYRADRGEGRYRRGYWLVLAVLMLAMSIDESVSFHEAFITLLAPLAAVLPLLHFAWVALAVPFVLLFGLTSLRFLAALPRPVAMRIAAAGTLFVVGALVFEMVDGYVLRRRGEDSAAYVVGYVLEDAFEMAGMTVYVVAAIGHLTEVLRRSGRSLSLSF